MSGTTWLRRRRGKAVSWIVVFGAAVPVHAQDRSFWSFIEPGRVVTRCAKSSAAHELSRARLDDFDRRIEKLENTDPRAEAVEELHALLRSECFLPAAETRRVPIPDSSESLKQWWADGGRAWLESYLELPEYGLVSDLVPHIVVPPDARKTLNLDAHRDHPLQNFLCGMRDTSCGAATRGWKLRADAHFESHRAMGRNDALIAMDEQPASRPRAASRECAEKAASSAVDQRYQAWRTCIESRRPRTVSLPLGGFKAPATGWFVISGRRGHYNFCDTTRAYDLASGAAFISDSCSGLSLRRDGDVDVDATDGARLERVTAGTLPVQNLREAVWMLLFRGEAEEVQLEAEYYPLPPGLVPRVTVRKEHDSSGSGMSSNTGQTTLVWRWMPATGSAFVGDVTWPNSYEAAEDHAVSLLAIAEEGLVAGCAAQRVPASAAFKSRSARNLNDVSAEAIGELDRALGKAFDKWKALPGCRTGAR